MPFAPNARLSAQKSSERRDYFDKFTKKTSRYKQKRPSNHGWGVVFQKWGFSARSRTDY